MSAWIVASGRDGWLASLETMLSKSMAATHRSVSAAGFSPGQQRTSLLVNVATTNWPLATVSAHLTATTETAPDHRLRS